MFLFAQSGYAFGTVYLDDHESFDYEEGEYIYLGIEYNNGTLTIRYVLILSSLRFDT